MIFIFAPTGVPVLLLLYPVSQDALLVHFPIFQKFQMQVSQDSLGFIEPETYRLQAASNTNVVVQIGYLESAWILIGKITGIRKKTKNPNFRAHGDLTVGTYMRSKCR